MSYYVYSRQISSGREDFCGVYDTMKEAVHRVAFLYQNDKPYNEDEYYYFIKAHISIRKWPVSRGKIAVILTKFASGGGMWACPASGG